MKHATLNPKIWITQHTADPRFPTDPDFVTVGALSKRYGIPVATITSYCSKHPGSCFSYDSMPWVDHKSYEQTLYFHEPTLQAAFKRKKA